jgi:hypothetical protein
MPEQAIKSQCVVLARRLLLCRPKVLTIKNGATIQLSKTLKPTWIHSCFDRKAWCKVSYLTLHRIGYIMTSKPIARFKNAQSANEGF